MPSSSVLAAFPSSSWALTLPPSGQTMRQNEVPMDQNTSISEALVAVQTIEQTPTPPEDPEDGHLQRPATALAESSSTRPVLPPSAPVTPVLQTNSNDFTIGLVSRVRLKWNRTHPPYANSFGPVKFEQASRPGPGLVVWFVAARSKVDRIWCLLHESLRSLIHSSQEKLESQRPPSTKGAHPTYVLECYLMGPDQGHATPCVCVSSDADWYRKAICALVKECARHLLDEHKFGCRGVRGVKPRPCTSPRRLSDAQLKDFQVWFQSPQSQEANGRMIEIFHLGMGVGKATIGGVVEIDGQVFGMTVRHAFMMPETPECETNKVLPDDIATDTADFSTTGMWDFDSDESDYGEDSEDNNNNNDNEDNSLDCHINDDYNNAGGCADDDNTSSVLSRRPSKVVVPDPEVGDDSSVSGVKSDDPEAKQRLLHLAKQLSENAALVAPASDLDWALTKMPGAALNKPFSRPSRDSLPERVQIKTPNQLLEADLRTKGIFGIHNLLAPQPVLVASVIGAGPGSGASGSWAMKRTDGEFVGMLIGSCPSVGSVYILPIQEILDDVFQHMGTTPTVPIFPSSPSPPSPSSRRSTPPPLEPPPLPLSRTGGGRPQGALDSPVNPVDSTELCGVGFPSSSSNPINVENVDLVFVQGFSGGTPAPTSYGAELFNDPGDADLTADQLSYLDFIDWERYDRDHGEHFEPINGPGIDHMHAGGTHNEVVGGLPQSSTPAYPGGPSSANMAAPVVQNMTHSTDPTMTTDSTVATSIFPEDEDLRVMTMAYQNQPLSVWPTLTTDSTLRVTTMPFDSTVVTSIYPEESLHDLDKPQEEQNTRRRKKSRSVDGKGPNPDSRGPDTSNHGMEKRRIP
ncbi:hypothetical protein VTJ49DRAFT_1043 [Mycothermus thermophilus]|uniref:Uncharacterized protein n=1 Tax=Humicola insolens TaxID=85995 RepID=A0ABR3VDR7_HUMIN